jgi:hypothetical protein
MIFTQKNTMNITAKLLYKTGSISMMLMGAGHNLLHLAIAGKNPAAAPVIQQMEAFKLVIMGFGSRSLLDFHHGFSFTMGTLLFFTGLQNFFLSSHLKSAFNSHKGIVWVPALLAGITFLLALTYFIILPQALSLIAFIAYAWSLLKLMKEKNATDTGALIKNSTDSRVKVEL